jgi:hypothetical protein
MADTTDPVLNHFVWRDLDTAPRNGSMFFALCVSRAPFDPVPTYTHETARWSGKSPSDTAGHFESKSGAIVTKWFPIPRNT